MKFPRTPHIYVEFSGVSEDDYGYSSKESDRILRGKQVTLTEKLDGTNVSIQAYPEIRINSRGNEAKGPEFSLLKRWCDYHQQKLRRILGENLIIFGEWLLLLHTIRYNKLPHYLILFDVYDLIDDRFLSYERVKEIAEEIGLPYAPILYSGIYPGFDFMRNLLQQKSHYGDENIEGVYGRVEEDGYTTFRFKFVNPEFLKAVNQSKHWRERKPEIQCLVGSIESILFP